MAHCPHGKWCHMCFCRGEQGLILYNNVIDNLNDGIERVFIKSEKNTWLEATLEDKIRIQNDPDKL